MSAGPFQDPENRAYGGADYELWSLSGKGKLKERVWSANLTGSAPPESVTLDEGVFDDPQRSTLDQWTDYGLRVRYNSVSGDCIGQGAFSEIRSLRTDDGSTALFDPAVIRDVYLDIPPASFDAINSEALPPGCVPFSRNYYPGTLRFEGQTLEGVGIHVKGGCGSSRDLSGKASFKVNIDWDDPAQPGCPVERRLFGQKHFTLNNGIQDSSASHESLAYRVFEAALVPTPRLAHVRVFVNDELWGLYQHVETIDRRFLERNFGSKEGMLYEGTYWCDFLPENLPVADEDTMCFTREFNPSACSNPEPGADPLDYSLLKELVLQINSLPAGGFYPAIDSLFDFDEFLSVWATEAVIGHWDGYAFSIQNNYRVYHDPSHDRWSLIDTGVDQTFGDDLDPWAPQGLLTTRCLAEPACEAAFAAKLKQVKDTFVAQNLGEVAANERTLIEPFIAADPRKEYDMGSFDQAHNGMHAFIAARPATIEAYLIAHGFPP